MTGSAAGHRRGMAFGTGAYLVWGVFPLYFLLLLPAGAVEALVHRILWTLAVCVLLLTITRTWRDVVPLLREPRRLLLLAAAAVVIAVNWVVYIYGVTTGRVVEASLGYFINPLVTVLLGVLVLRERLRPLQWAAVGVGGAAVAGLTADYGRLPWISVVLAVSFGSYGLLKNRVGRGTGALASLTAETALLAPLALVALAWLTGSGRSTFILDPPGHALLLASTGVVTALPLLMFAAAARRIPLSTIGLLQYLTPVLQFLCGVVLLGERMPASRWVGFAAVWLALVVLSVDAVRAARGRARAARSAAAPAAVPA